MPSNTAPTPHDVVAHLRTAGVAVDAATQLAPGMITVHLGDALHQLNVAVEVARQIVGVVDAVEPPGRRSVLYLMLAAP